MGLVVVSHREHAFFCSHPAYLAFSAYLPTYLPILQVVEFDAPLTLLQRKDSHFRALCEKAGDVDGIIETFESASVKAGGGKKKKNKAGNGGTKVNGEGSTKKNNKNQETNGAGRVE